MASKIRYKASVEKDLKKLDAPAIKKILNKIEKDLGSDPGKGESLKGDFKGLFRYRIGDNRVVYSKTREGILVLRIGHRRDVYHK